MRPVIKGTPPKYPYDNEPADQAASKWFAASSATATVNNPTPGSTTGPAIHFTFDQIMNELLHKQVRNNVHDTNPANNPILEETIPGTNYANVP